MDDLQALGHARIARGTRTKSRLPASPSRKKNRCKLTRRRNRSAKFKGLIGEYGYDHLPLYIYEKDGKLHALIELTEIDPLTEESENVFAFPANRGMYHGEKLVFTRDASGRATKVTVANVVMQRRKIDGENGETFKIKSVKRAR